jgi:DNA mismatch endonuclease (patch repair protein)
MPKTRVEFWQEKFRQNVERDKVKKDQLLESGWTVLTVWECMSKDDNKLREVLDCLFVKRTAH